MTVFLTEFTRQPCNSARGRKNGGWHPNLKPIRMYPNYYWCTHCGASTGMSWSSDGWKSPESCYMDKGGKVRCPDCSNPVRTEAKQWRREKYRRRTAKRRAEREANK